MNRSQALTQLVPVLADRSPPVHPIGNRRNAPAEASQPRRRTPSAPRRLQPQRPLKGVFDPSFDFIRKMPLRHIVGLKPYTHFLDDGNILSSFSTAGSQPQRLFSILDRELNANRAFGEPGPAVLSSPRGVARKTTYASDSTFWAASPRDGEPGNLLEQWSTSGNFLQTIVRNVPWFPAADPSAPRSRDVPPPPTLVAVNEGPDGRLLVLAAVPNSDWQNFDDPTADDDVEAVW